MTRQKEQAQSPATWILKPARWSYRTLPIEGKISLSALKGVLFLFKPKEHGASWALDVGSLWAEPTIL